MNGSALGFRETLFDGEDELRRSFVQSFCKYGGDGLGEIEAALGFGRTLFDGNPKFK